MYLRIFVLMACLSLALNGETWATENWKERKSTHFIIYYNQAPAAFIDNVEEMAEYYYSKIASDMGFTRYKSWSWDKRAKIYIFDNAEDFQKSGELHWADGVTYSSAKIIRSFPAAHGFFDSTLPHELAHIIFREFVGLKAKVPVWFEEGIAMYQEKARRWGADDIVRQALKDGTFLSLEEMAQIQLSDKMDLKVIKLIYAESASVINYLINTWGRQRFVMLCRKLQNNTQFEWAVHSVYINFKDIQQLNKAWVAYLGR